MSHMNSEKGIFIVQKNIIKTTISCICLMVSIVMIAPIATGKALASPDYCHVNCVWEAEMEMWACRDICKSVPTADCCIVPLVGRECAENYYCWWVEQ